MSWLKLANINATLLRASGGAHEPVAGTIACVQPYLDHEGRETALNRRVVLPTPFSFYETLVVGEPQIEVGDVMTAGGVPFIVRRVDLFGPTPNIPRYTRLGLERSIPGLGTIVRHASMNDGMGGRTDTWNPTWSGDIVLHPSYVGADMLAVIDVNRRESEKAPYRIEVEAAAVVQVLDRVRCLGVGIVIEVLAVHVAANGSKWLVGVEL